MLTHSIPPWLLTQSTRCTDTFIVCVCEYEARNQKPETLTLSQRVKHYLVVTDLKLLQRSVYI